MAKSPREGWDFVKRCLVILTEICGECKKLKFQEQPCKCGAKKAAKSKKVVAR